MAEPPSSGLDETFEAILADWTLVEPLFEPAPGAVGYGQPGGLLADLLARSVHLLLADFPGQPVDDHADLRPAPPDRLVCFAPSRSASTGRPPEEALGPDEAGAWLADRGVTGPLVLVLCAQCVPGRSKALAYIHSEPWLARAVVVCLLHEPHRRAAGILHPGPAQASIQDVLAGQRERRAGRRVPQIDPDPAWVVPLDTNDGTARRAEALGTLGNGMVASRASVEESQHGASLLKNGAYTADNTLLEGPIWTVLGGNGQSSGPRFLDLRTGVLARTPIDGDGMKSVRFVSVADPAAMAMRAEMPDSPSGEVLRPPPEPEGWERTARNHSVIARTGQEPGARIFVAARDRAEKAEHGWCVERLAAWATGERLEGNEEAFQSLRSFEEDGFDRLLCRHRGGWAELWAGAGVSIEGPERDQLAARFAMFHLLSSVPGEGEAAVGARGLSGPAYGGHVFWDADVFVLPALAAIRPGAARAMLEYRIRRLPAAMAAARLQGRSGARFPWESAADGSNVTPRAVRGPTGRLIPIATGSHELHIVADIAWSAMRYAEWTGDRQFVRIGPGRELVVETARYWASRTRTDGAGRAHLYGVMGPDEYHQVVDDNAFTNVMARWNLRAAAALLARDGAEEEAATMRALAAALVDGWVPRLGIFEQFAGYFALEPLRVSDVAQPPVAIDVVLGADRVTGSQLIKQPDVLMLHHMLPGETPPGSLSSCLDFYGPRTAHGSSLSPAVHASLLARAGRPDEALEWFRTAARLDLDDVTGTTGQGLHLATMGGVWQALAYGFLGLSVGDRTLRIDPCLPAEWSALRMRFHLHRQTVDISVDSERVIVACESPLRVRLGSNPTVRCRPPTTVLPRPGQPRSAGDRRLRYQEGK